MVKSKISAASPVPAKKAKQDEIRNAKELVQLSAAAAKKSEEEAKEIRNTIRMLETSVYESKTNYNNIVALQKHLADEGDFDTALYASQSLRRVFATLLKNKETSFRTRVYENFDAASKKVAEWLNSQMWKFAKTLLRWVSQREVLQVDNGLVLAAIDSLLDMYTSDSQITEGVLASTEVSNLLAHTLIALFTSPVSELVITEFRLKWFMKYDDVRLASYKILVKFLFDTSLLTPFRDTAVVEVGKFIDNLLSLLVLMKWGEISHSNLINSVKKVHHQNTHPDITKQRRELNNLWNIILTQDLTPKGYRSILQIMDTVIIPNITNPLELAGFLTTAFEQGGLTSILALSGLLLLISKHNLDYPNFFSKLYSLCTPLALANNQIRFLKLLEKVLNGPNLPTYVIAAFTKRLIRVSMYTPPNVSYFILAFVFNLIRKHPIVSTIVNRNVSIEKGKVKNAQMSGDQVNEKYRGSLFKKNAAPDTTEASDHNDSEDEEIADEDDSDMNNDEEKPQVSLFSLLSAGKKATEGSTIAKTDTNLLLIDTNMSVLKAENAWEHGVDPFIDGTHEPSQSCAIESSLLEIYVFCNHYIHDITRIAKLYHADNAPKIGYNMEHYISQTYQSMFDDALKFKENRMTAATFTLPNTLLGKSERVINPDEKYDLELQEAAKKLDVPSILEQTFQY